MKVKEDIQLSIDLQRPADNTDLNEENLPGLTVSIVAYNTKPEELETCLMCLAGPEVKEIVIIDNSTSPKIEKFIAEKFPHVRYIASDNVGYGRAHNHAFTARNRKTPYHLVVNSDIYFGPEVLPELLSVMELNPEISMIHPMLVNNDGSRQFSVRKLPTPADLFVRRFMPHSFFTKSRLRYLLYDLDCSHAYRLPYFQGSFLLLRSGDFERIGMFDSRYFMYPEDIDLSRRLFFDGTIVYYPFVKVVHNHRHQSYSSGRLLRLHIINMIKYFNKWGWFFDRRRRKVNREIDALLDNSSHNPPNTIISNW